MKKILLIATMIVVFAFPIVARGQALNVVYIDVQKVMVESDKGKEAKQTLSREAERLKKNLDGKQSELQKMKDAIEKQGATITPDARAEKEKQYQGKLKDYQRLVSDSQTELQQKDMEYTQKILKDIEEAVKSLGEKEKYTLILEKSQSGILFASPSIDITPKVISLVNEAAKKKQPTNKK
ncbi:MAG: periplasmic chaperone [Syntrophorhabdus sp. PtaU1.Bin153]|nr:MAG: periplasmic chaperone [Syntrophorhabdus sp. PtaU1.Bin153]